MRRLRRWLIVLAFLVATVVGICILLVVIPFVIGAHDANENIAAMRRLINTTVVPGTTAPHVRVFLHGHAHAATQSLRGGRRFGVLRSPPAL